MKQNGQILIGCQSISSNSRGSPTFSGIDDGHSSSSSPCFASKYWQPMEVEKGLANVFHLSRFQKIDDDTFITL